MEIQRLYQLFLDSTGVSTDTRTIQKGSIFFALKGDNFDGNRFISNALEAGAAFAIADDPSISAGEQVIKVSNVLETLQELARFHRKTLKAKIVGITGTNGKTTTKELIHAVLSSHYNTRATAGNLNNHIGVPLTILGFKGDEDFGIIEMGANHPGEIAELCTICDPDFGIITNIGKAHLEGFGTFENIISTKKGLYDHLAKKNGLIFLNLDNPILCENNVQQQVGYGTGTGNYCRGIHTGQGPFVSLRVEYEKEAIDIQTQLVGGYNFENVLAACCIGRYFNVPAEKIKSAIEHYRPTNNRSEYRRTARNELILDAYNANPTSMEKALENFAEISHPDKLAILGDMFELGDQAPMYHRHVISKAQELKIPTVFVGKEFAKTSEEGGAFFETVEEFAAQLKQQPPTGKLILIKGSRGIKLERIVELL